MNDLQLVIQGIEKTESLVTWRASEGKFRLDENNLPITTQKKDYPSTIEPLNPPFKKCPQYVRDSVRILITHAGNAVRFFLFIDVDIHECPEPLKKWLMLYRVKHMLDGTTRNSWHIILEITDTDQAGLDRLATNHHIIDGLEMWSKNRGFALLGSFYGEMERDGPKAKQSEWQFVDEEIKVNVIRGMFPKCTAAEFTSMMYEVAGGRTAKPTKNKKKLDPELPPPKGSRNDYFSRIAWKYAHTNTRPEVLAMCRGINVRSADPWDDKSLMDVVDSAFNKIDRGELENDTQNRALELFKKGMSKTDINRKLCEGKQQTEKNLIMNDVAEAQLFFKQFKKTDEPQDKEDKKKQRMNLVNILEANHNFTRIKGDKDGLMLETNRLYEPYGEDDLSNLIIKYDPERDSETRSYTIQYIKDKYVTSIEKFDNDHTILNFQNTFVKITKDGHRALKESELPEGYKSMKQHPVNYRPELEGSDDYINLVKQILPDEWQSRLELSGLLWLRSLVNPEKLFIHDGDGANGKSTLMHIDVGILGDKQITSVKPEEISEDAYAGAELQGKFACIAHDISDKKLEDFNMLKSLAMRDETVSMQHKYGHRFDMKNHAVIQAACNRKFQIPNFAYPEARRLHVFSYTERFDGDMVKKEYHKKFLDSEDKKSKILNTMLDYAVKMLNSDGVLTDAQSPEKVMEIWGDAIKSITGFMEMKIIITNNIKDVIPKDELYREYVKACEGMHKATCTEQGPAGKCCSNKAESMTKFSRMLSSSGLEYRTVSIMEKRLGIGGA